ncbi:MAG: hypothetical protein WCA28_06015 [Bradyrhizobium sp.]
MHLSRIFPAALAIAAFCLGANVAAAEAPAPGCYERIYDPGHLAAHPGQLVVRATVLVKPLDPSEAKAFGPAFTADAHLKMWVKGQKPSFDSFGACRPADGGLACEGSLSTAEADECKSKNDGVHRDCRIGTATTGAFGVAVKADGLMVTILRRLELVPEPYDGGPFLYLSPGNAENHAFALKPAPVSSCK